MTIFSGFLLTSHQYDYKNQLVLEYYVKSKNSIHLLRITNQKIVFFIPKMAGFNPSCQFERKTTTLKSFDKGDVDSIYVNTLADLQQCRVYCENNGIKSFELDIPMHERFLMERFIHGQIEYTGDSLKEGHYLTFENPQVRATKDLSPTDLAILSLDIETGVDQTLYSIAIHQRSNGVDLSHVFMLDQLQTYSNQDNISYYQNEKMLLQHFLQIFSNWDPDILVGWHVIGFDLMFLEQKCQQFGLKLNLGRKNDSINLFDKPGVGYFADCIGRIILDGPPVLRGAFFQFKNFKLETVAREVLNKGKDIASDDNKVDEIEKRFKTDKVSLAHYNLLDATLVLDIFSTLKIIDLLCARVFISGLLMDRLNVSTAAFDFVYLPRLHRKGFVAPNRIDINRDEAASGGMVIEPKQGMHQNVAVFDFKSLYPSIIMTFHIGPLALIKADVNPIQTPMGYTYSQSESLLPEIIQGLMQKREIAKAHNNKSLSQAIKILMNSFYGILGSSRSRFYHSEHPQAITTTGHFILEETMKFLSAKGLDVIYGDTDSIFVKGSISSPQQLANEINLYLKQNLFENFKVESKLECQYEKTFDKLYFSPARSGVGTAKKRYCGMIKGEIEFKGMETVRSDWTELAKIFQKKLYENFFNGLELEETIKSFIKAVEAGLYDEYLVYTKKLSKDITDYKKNIPPHVQAASKIKHQGPYRLKEVSYVYTLNGPEPIQNHPGKFDYNHYIEKQLKPIANDILIPLNKNFDSLISGDQLSLI